MVSLRLGCDEGIILPGNASAPGQPAATVLTTTELVFAGIGDFNYSCEAENLAYLSDFLDATITQRHLRYLGGNHGGLAVPGGGDVGVGVGGLRGRERQEFTV